MVRPWTQATTRKQCIVFYRVSLTRDNMPPYNSALITSSPKSTMEILYHSTCNWLSEVSEYVASKRIGQFLFRKVDGLMWTIEKTILWSVEAIPKASPETSGPTTDEATISSQPGSSSERSTGSLVRPLPWVFFLPLLLMIRIARFAAGIVVRATGNEPPKPKEMVRCIQTMRRRLRVIRFRGMRNLKNRENDASAMSKLTSFLTSKVPNTSANGKKSELNEDWREKKRKFTEVEASSLSDDEAADESTEDLMNRAVLEEAANQEDPDFEPNCSLDVFSDTSFTSSFDEDDEELRRPPSVKRQLSRPRSLISSDVIEEVSEDSSTLTVSTENDDDDDDEDMTRETPGLDDGFSSCQDKSEAETVDGAGMKEEGVGTPEDATAKGVGTPEDATAKGVGTPEDATAKGAATLENATAEVTQGEKTESVEAVNSDCESTSSTFLSTQGDDLSLKSGEMSIVSSNASSCVDISDHSHDSAMQKMSSLFSIKKKATPKSSV